MTDNNKDWTLISALFDQLQGADDETIEVALRSRKLDSESETLLRKMLRADGEKNILDESLDELAAGLLDGGSLDETAAPDVHAGERFGAWRVTREIDRGGMGAVFEAERADGQFEKTVALKIIRPGTFTASAKERFLEEMRMLARLEHPGIVRLIDGGITENQIPWFAMDLVEGNAITRHADANKLTLHDRIVLLIAACDAVEHAHRNLIVHGDIKPSNILVTKRGEVRLVDFGIARSLQDEQTAASVSRLTPGYASPELASGARITTATDVFGLCAVLYEMLCGLAPRESVATTTHADYRSFILTPIPNALQQYNNSPSNREIADHRSTNIRKLRKLLKGDLQWILDLGLRVDANKRLHSVAELRKDLLRFLEGLPVDAHPPSKTYRLGKFLRRYRVPVVAGTAAVVVLSASTAIATRQADIAEHEADKARWTSNFLMQLFDEADPWRNQQRPITVNELSATAVDEVLDNRDDLDADTRESAVAILARVETRLGHLDTAEQLHNLQLELLEQLGSDPRDMALALTQLGMVKSNQSETDVAIELFARARQTYPLSTRPDDVSVLAVLEHAHALSSSENLEAANAALDLVFDIEVEIRTLQNSHELLAKLYNVKSDVLRQEGEYEGAREAAGQAMAFANAASKDVSVLVGKTLLNLSEAYFQLGDSEVAIQLDEQVVDIFSTYYGLDHPQTLESQGRVAVAASNLGRMEDAIGAYEKVLAGQRAALGPENQYVAATLLNIGSAYLAIGDADQALQYYSEAQLIFEGLEPAAPVYLALNMIGIARSLHALQRMQEADMEFSAALDILQSATGTDHPIYSRAEVYRAPLLLDLDRLDEAATILPAAYENILAAYGADSKHTALAGLRWAQLLARIGMEEQALQLVNDSIAVFDSDAHRRRHSAELNEARQLLSNAE